MFDCLGKVEKWRAVKKEEKQVQMTRKTTMRGDVRG